MLCAVIGYEGIGIFESEVYFDHFRDVGTFTFIFNGTWVRHLLRFCYLCMIWYFYLLLFFLSPIGSRLEFPVQLENKHVIEPEQIFVRVIGESLSVDSSDILIAL